MQASPRIFDRAALRRRRERAAASGAPADFLLAAVAEDIAERLTAINRSFPLALDLGSQTGLLADAVLATGKVGTVVRMDSSPALLIRQRGLRVAADEEALPFGESVFDLIVSALGLHFVNDLPGTLVQARRALKPDGLFLGAMLGYGTLQELKDAFAVAETELTGGVSPRVAPFAEVRAAGGLLQRAGLALPVTDQDALTVRYPNALALMADLRAMGATNIMVERSRQPLRRAVLLRAAEIYQARFADPDGRVRATFQVISLSGWAPHESQQKPLAPGSARMRLADALAAAQSPGPKPGAPGEA